MWTKCFIDFKILRTLGSVGGIKVRSISNKVQSENSVSTMKSYLVVLLAVLIQQIYCNEQGGFVHDLEELDNLTNSTGGRIAGGQSALKTRFKEFVYLMVYKDGTSTTCGGSLFKANWVLTAAHCIFEYVLTIYL